jgi:hypothetical protein
MLSAPIRLAAKIMERTRGRTRAKQIEPSMTPSLSDSRRQKKEKKIFVFSNRRKSEQPYIKRK